MSYLVVNQTVESLYRQSLGLTPCQQQDLTDQRLSQGASAFPFLTSADFCLWFTAFMRPLFASAFCSFILLVVCHWTRKQGSARTWIKALANLVMMVGAIAGMALFLRFQMAQQLRYGNLACWAAMDMCILLFCNGLLDLLSKGVGPDHEIRKELYTVFRRGNLLLVGIALGWQARGHALDTAILDEFGAVLFVTAPLAILVCTALSRRCDLLRHPASGDEPQNNPSRLSENVLAALGCLLVVVAPCKQVNDAYLFLGDALDPGAVVIVPLTLWATLGNAVVLVLALVDAACRKRLRLEQFAPVNTDGPASIDDGTALSTLPPVQIPFEQVYSAIDTAAGPSPNPERIQASPLNET